MIIVTRRSASVPLPPFVRASQKGVRVVRFSSAPCAYRLPCPHPSPRSRPSVHAPTQAPGHGRPDSSLPPPTPGGGFNYICLPAPPKSQSPPLPPLASSLPPPTPGGGFNYICLPAPPKSQSPPLPPLASSLPPPTPGGGLITFAIPSTMAIPSHVPTHPPLAPVRPRLSASSEARTSGQLAPPRAAPGGVDYIYYTMETIIACPPPITPPTAIDFMLPSSYHLQKPTQAPASADARSRGALLGSRTTAALNAIVNNT